jgi:hypothetical protein
MGYKRNRKEYNETGNRRTHKVLHIISVTDCCLKCAIRRRQTYYHIAEYNGKTYAKIPNWKLVSKNRKQWMKKGLKLVESKRNNYQSRQYTSIEW